MSELRIEMPTGRFEIRSVVGMWCHQCEEWALEPDAPDVTPEAILMLLNVHECKSPTVDGRELATSGSSTERRVWGNVAQ